MRGFFATLCAAGLWAGCSFDPPPPVQEDGGPVDAARPDAIVLACEPDTTVCDDSDGRYIECGSDGMATRVIECPLGCATDVEKCVDIDPSNGLAPYLDMLRTRADIPTVAFSGDSSMNTSDGTVYNGPDLISVPSETFTSTRVFMFRGLTITGNLKVTGAEAVVFLVDGDIEITGLIDVSADGATPGPGAVTQSSTCHGTGTQLSSSSPTPGGGGAGHYQTGANGGGSNGVTNGFVGGSAARDDVVVPLVGGCRGGGIIEACVPPQPPSLGGGGGGAIQVVSTGEIRILGSGRIDASGGGGRSADACGPIGGAGGGSGGSILLEAASVLLDGPGVVLSTKGGGGAAAGEGATTDHGRDGGTDSPPAPGGSHVTYADGGSGGNETTAPTAGGTGGSSSDGGGGGGSVGQTRINTATSGVNPQNGATIRSRYSTDTIATRLIP